MAYETTALILSGVSLFSSRIAVYILIAIKMWNDRNGKRSKPDCICGNPDLASKLLANGFRIDARGNIGSKENGGSASRGKSCDACGAVIFG